MAEKPNENLPISNAKVYFKALSVGQLSDIELIKTEINLGNIIVAKITPLAKKSIEDTTKAVDELCTFVEKVGGDIARLGEERLVITPPSIKIWKEKENHE